MRLYRGLSPSVRMVASRMSSTGVVVPSSFFFRYLLVSSAYRASYSSWVMFPASSSCFSASTFSGSYSSFSMGVPKESWALNTPSTSRDSSVVTLASVLASSRRMVSFSTVTPPEMISSL